MVIITQEPISPDEIVKQAKTNGSGCVVTYVGLIRDNSQGKPVLSVEYSDPDGTAAASLERIVDDVKGKWEINNLVICHRTGKLMVGDINLVVALASAHRKEGFEACQYVIDQFKDRLPTYKIETYL